jgi:flagellar basal body-associated protein FliL
LKFLENIIETLNLLIEKLIEKFFSIIPHFVFDFIKFIKNVPFIIKHKYRAVTPKLRIYSLKFIGYSQHYTTLMRGQFTELLIYLRSEEFKKDKKTALIIKPIRYVKTHPLKITYVSSFITIFSIAFCIIFLNTNKIIVGTKSRAPASVEKAEGEDAVNIKNIFLIKHHKFEVKVGGGGGGGHGGGAVHHEEEIVSGDIKLILINEHKKEIIEEFEVLIDDYLEAIEIEVPSLPFDDTEKAKLELIILKELNEGLHTFAGETPITAVKIEFHQHERAEYYRKNERSYSLQNVDLQVFQEDLKRNHQVYIDFTVVGSNRNIVLFLKDHEALIRDRLSTNVEPILPRLPIEDEGKRIIKDKIRDELNEILTKEKVEGRITEVYLDFSISS